MTMKQEQDPRMVEVDRQVRDHAEAIGAYWTMVGDAKAEAWRWVMPRAAAYTIALIASAIALS